MVVKGENMSNISLTGYMDLGIEFEKISNEGRLFIVNRPVSLDEHMKIVEAIQQIIEYGEVITDCLNMD